MSVNMIKQSAESENLSLKPEVNALLVELGVEPISYTGGTLVAKTPITGEVDSQPGTGPHAGYPNVHHAFP
jgi:aldehyde dehydrogenase (NAD+)